PTTAIAQTAVITTNAALIRLSQLRSRGSMMKPPFIQAARFVEPMARRADRAPGADRAGEDFARAARTAGGRTPEAPSAGHGTTGRTATATKENQHSEENLAKIRGSDSGRASAASEATR